MSTVVSQGRSFVLNQESQHWVVRFVAMAGPCELYIQSDSRDEVETAARLVVNEACRIEQKFSRYRSDNIIHKINHAEGASISVDDETALLLDYAQACHTLSDGLFDITSGVLRRVWRFGPDATLPSQSQIEALLPLVGWYQVQWSAPHIRLLPGMEIDLGGIGKEYAVDRCASLLLQSGVRHALLNFGGDLFAIDGRRDRQTWQVAVDDPHRSGEGAIGFIEIARGGVATSGDARRFVMHAGRRYGHILDPRTGWPAIDAPHGVTVVAGTCLEAGMLATLAMLQGKDAERFLDGEGVRYYCAR